MENYQLIGFIDMEEIEFIEKYCLVNGKHIKLTNHQKEFIKWLNQLKSETES